MMIAILIAVFAGAITFDYRLFHREIAPGEKVLYLLILAIGFSILTLSELGVTIASPAAPIQNAVKALFGPP